MHMKNILLIVMSVLTLALNAEEYTGSWYREYLETNGDTFNISSGAYFKAGWTSVDDIMNVGGSLYLQKDYKIESRAQYNISGSKITANGFYVEDLVDVFVSNSELNISDRIYVDRGANTLTIKDSITKFNGTSSSQVKNGSTFIVDGGSFEFTGDKMQMFSVESGSSIQFKNTTANIENISFATRVNSSFPGKSAEIVFDNSTVKAGVMDLYGYGESDELPVVKIINGSDVTMSVDLGYANMRSGTITVSDGSVLNVTSALIADKKYNSSTCSVIAENGSKIIVQGDVSLDNLTIGGEVEADNIKADSLVVQQGASIKLAEEGTVEFNNLEIIVSEDLSAGGTLDLNELFADGLSVVLAGLGENQEITVSNGNMSYSAVAGENGIVTIVPEPSTYAVIIGALALAFAAYRRRK